MFLLTSPINHKEQAAIERRRRAENARVSRIFDEKYRTIGVDFDKSIKTSFDQRQKKFSDR